MEKAIRIGLVDVDGHAKKKKWGATIYPNLALSKIARYWKQQGAVVEWAEPFTHYDKVYMSKVFNFSTDDLNIYNADEIIKGGTGYDIASALPREIDRLQPDYSIYPHIPKDTSYGFLTRGCPNKCPWCVVPKKEGAIRPYMDVDEIAIDGRRNIVLMDNNILAAGDYAISQFEKIIERGYRVDFNQALDARLVTEDFARLLAKMKWLDNSRIRFGCDTPAQIEDCERAIDMINRNGFRGQYFLYTMIGGKARKGESDDDAQRRMFAEGFSRINHWWERMHVLRITHKRNIIYAYSQPYRDPENINADIPEWQRDIARWCNKRQIFTIMPFAEFSPRKGFYCREYFDKFGITPP